jgi:hypothetical protein
MWSVWEVPTLFSPQASLVCILLSRLLDSTSLLPEGGLAVQLGHVGGAQDLLTLTEFKRARGDARVSPWSCACVPALVWKPNLACFNCQHGSTKTGPMPYTSMMQHDCCHVRLPLACRQLYHHLCPRCFPLWSARCREFALWWGPTWLQQQPKWPSQHIRKPGKPSLSTHLVRELIRALLHALHL